MGYQQFRSMGRGAWKGKLAAVLRELLCIWYCCCKCLGELHLMRGSHCGLYALFDWQVLASKVRVQVNASRTEAAPIQNFNYSTTMLLKHYLSGKEQMVSVFLLKLVASWKFAILMLSERDFVVFVF